MAQTGVQVNLKSVDPRLGRTTYPPSAPYTFTEGGISKRCENGKGGVTFLRTETSSPGSPYPGEGGQPALLSFIGKAYVRGETCVRSDGSSTPMAQHAQRGAV